MEKKPIDLLKSFLRLQGRRVQTYQSFDACLRDYLQSLDKAKYVEGCKRITAEFSRISQEIIAIEESLRACERTLLTADTIRKVQELEREKLKKTVVRQAFLALHADDEGNSVQKAQPEDYDDLAAQEAELEYLKEAISGELESVQEEIYEMEEDICFDDEDPVIVRNVVGALCRKCHAASISSHDFDFYHYCCDRVHDKAWGPSGRCIQIAASAMGRDVPSIPDIQQALPGKSASDLEKVRRYIASSYGLEGKVVVVEEEDFSDCVCGHLSKGGVPVFISDTSSGTTLVIAAVEKVEGGGVDSLSVLVVDPRVCTNVGYEDLERCTYVPENGLSYNISSTLFCGWSNLKKLLSGKKWEALFI